MALLVCRQQQWKRGAIIFGLGMGIAFLSKGLAVPVILCISSLLLISLFKELRSKRLVAIFVFALLAASPFLIIWPYLLYQYSYPLFMEWFWNNNVGRFLGFSVGRLGANNSPGYIFSAVLWFAFPAFPLACIAVIKQRKSWRRPEYLLPLVVSVTGLALLLSSASARALYLLPLIPAFAILGAQGLMNVPEGALVAWNKMVRILASMAGLVLITMWVCLLHPGGPQPFAKLYGEWLPLGFLPERQSIACIAALAFVCIWIVSFRLKSRSAESTATVWFCAVVVLWGLGNTLLLPWADETRSFRPVIENLNRFVSQTPYQNKCIARYDLGESVSPMWEYFGEGRGLGPQENFDGKSCPLLLLMTGKSMKPVSDPRWHQIWKGSRLLDDKDELQLYERNL
jgi:4-amino-4-deoxy-L-arabinose transferase-like glycosyltransferase